MPPAHHGGKRRGHGGVGQGIDLETGNHRLLRPVGLPDRQAEADCAAIVAKGCGRLHRQRQQGGLSWRRDGPASHHIVRIGFQPDTGGTDPGRPRLADEPIKILLLLENDLFLIVAQIGVAEPDRCAHGVEGGEQFAILVLRLVEQDVDPDRLRPHGIDVPQRPRQQAPVERRPLARGDQGLIVIDQHQDALVLRHAGREGRGSPVVQASLRIGGQDFSRPSAAQGTVPVPPGQEQRQQQKRPRRCQAPASRLPHQSRAAAQQAPHRHDDQRRAISGRAPSPMMAKPDQ